MSFTRMPQPPLFRPDAPPAEPPSSSALVLHRAGLAERAGRYAQLSEDERKRAAAQAVAGQALAPIWELVEAHLTLHGERGARVSAETLRTYRVGVREYLAWAGREAVSLLRPKRDAGAAYVRFMEGQGLSAASVRVRLSAARVLYRALRWADLTGAAPFAEVRAAPDRTPRHEKRQPYSEAELDALLAAAAPRERVLLLLGAHTGLRVSELVALEWRDVNLASGELRVRHGKGGKQGRVYASKRLIAALEAWQLEQRLPAGVVLGYRNPDAARHQLGKVAQAAGVDSRGRGVHSLRHYAGTRVYRETRDLKRVADHLRHADVSTSAIYAKHAEDALRETTSGW